MPLPLPVFVTERGTLLQCFHDPRKSHRPVEHDGNIRDDATGDIRFLLNPVPLVAVDVADGHLSNLLPVKVDLTRHYNCGDRFRLCQFLEL